MTALEIRRKVRETVPDRSIRVRLLARRAGQPSLFRVASRNGESRLEINSAEMVRRFMRL